MTGPEHYREAERLLTIAGGGEQFTEIQQAAIAGCAQAHATLALVDAVRRAPVDVGEAINRSARVARRERRS